MSLCLSVCLSVQDKVLILLINNMNYIISFKGYNQKYTDSPPPLLFIVSSAYWGCPEYVTIGSKELLLLLTSVQLSFLMLLWIDDRGLLYI